MSDASHGAEADHTAHTGPDGTTFGGSEGENPVRSTRSRTDSDHTAARLVAAAEFLFTEGGEEATSLRAITRQARSNAAAVHYHFGGRDELLRTLVDERLAALAPRRAALLEEIPTDTDGADATVEAVVEALVRPDLELLASLRLTGRIHLARFLGRAQTLPASALVEQAERRFEAVVSQVLPVLRRVRVDLEVDELRSRLRLITAALAYAFASAPDPGRDGPWGADIDEQVDRLVTVFAAGLLAPPSSARRTAAGMGTGTGSSVGSDIAAAGPAQRAPIGFGRARRSAGEADVAELEMDAARSAAKRVRGKSPAGGPPTGETVRKEPGPGDTGQPAPGEKAVAAKASSPAAGKQTTKATPKATSKPVARGTSKVTVDKKDGRTEKSDRKRKKR